MKAHGPVSVACDPVKVPLCADERADSFLVPDECVGRCIEPRVSLGRGQSCRSPKKRMVERSGLSRAAKHLFQGQARSRSEEHTSELQSLMRISYAVFCL